MKKLLLCITVLSLIIFSCEKNNDISQTKIAEAKMAVTLTVSDFNVEIADFNNKSAVKQKSAETKTSAVSKYIKELYYVVYDKSGKEVKRLYQFIEDKNFGCLKDSLPKGDYTAVVVGSKQFLG